ncbi:MAG: DUF6304 family protein [Ruminococcus flavefaciens]|nr:DUF6304 family protein [Ruminococcus flavefaciens]
MQVWKAHYKDEFHDTDIEILNDGSERFFILDGFKFCLGTDISEIEYESTEPSDDIENKFHVVKYYGYLLDKYSTRRIPTYFYILWRYSLDVEIPVHVFRKADNAEITGTINISLHLVKHDMKKPHGIILCNGVRIYCDDVIVDDFSLCVDGKSYHSEKNTIDFETALSDICGKIKQDYYIKSCFTCQYSDYSPYGQNGFGGIMCYRECKENCLKVHGRNDYHKYLEEQPFTFQEETYLCSEYDLRNKCGGIRGFVDI